MFGRDDAVRLAIVETELVAMKEDVVGIKKDLASVRRAFYTLAMAIVSASIIFAFSVLALIGKH